MTCHMTFHAGKGAKPMFDDLFDFGKRRTLKQSVGFFIFYGGIALSVTGLLSLLGL